MEHRSNPETYPWNSRHDKVPNDLSGQADAYVSSLVLYNLHASRATLNVRIEEADPFQSLLLLAADVKVAARPLSRRAGYKPDRRLPAPLRK